MVEVVEVVVILVVAVGSSMNIISSRTISSRATIATIVTIEYIYANDKSILYSSATNQQKRKTTSHPSVSIQKNQTPKQSILALRSLARNTINPAAYQWRKEEAEFCESTWRKLKEECNT